MHHWFNQYLLRKAAAGHVWKIRHYIKRFCDAVLTNKDISIPEMTFYLGIALLHVQGIFSVVVFLNVLKYDAIVHSMTYNLIMFWFNLLIIHICWKFYIIWWVDVMVSDIF